MERRWAIAANTVRAMGVVLLVVAAIHLVVTPVLANALAHSVSDEQWQFLRAPTLINHIVVGVLLVPIGVTLIALTGQLRTGARWAWWLAMVHALAVVSLPIVLVAVVPLALFEARPFLIASVLVTLVAVTLPVVLLWARPTSR